MTSNNEEFFEVSQQVPLVKSHFCRFIVPQYEIVKYFSDVSSKNDVVEGVLDFGGRCFSNLAIFSVFSNSIQLLKGKGDNIRDIIHFGAIKVDENTIIRRTIMSKVPYKGKIPVGPDERIVFGRFFNRLVEEIFLYPGIIRGDDTDILFCADDFEGERDSSIATFEYIVEKAILSLRYLWVKKQLSTI